MRLVAITLLYLMCMLKNGFALENPYCVNWLTGVIVKLFDGGYGYMRLDDGWGTLAAVEGGGFYVGMKVPKYKNQCLSYTHNTTAMRKDGSECWLKHYVIAGRNINKDVLDYLTETIEAEKISSAYDARHYVHCGSDVDSLR